MHEAIRVPIKSLEALEADRYDSLPHPAFVKGYIKACCKELGLDENDRFGGFGWPPLATSIAGGALVVAACT